MSFLYSSSALYHFFMKTIYGGSFLERYERIAGRIPSGASVVDVCCGDSFLYTNYLKVKNVKYLGLDASPGFARDAARRQIRFVQTDLQKDEIPEGDYVVMMGSLYQFMPHHEAVLKKLLKAARREVILCEPVVNLVNSKNPLIRALARAVTFPHGMRLAAKDLEPLFERYGAKEVKFICGGREIIGIFTPS